MEWQFCDTFSCQLSNDCSSVFAVLLNRLYDLCGVSNTVNRQKETREQAINYFGKVMLIRHIYFKFWFDILISSRNMILIERNEKKNYPQHRDPRHSMLWCSWWNIFISSFIHDFLDTLDSSLFLTKSSHLSYRQWQNYC